MQQTAKYQAIHANTVGHPTVHRVSHFSDGSVANLLFG
jgi:hypothetical protein